MTSLLANHPAGKRPKTHALLALMLAFGATVAASRSSAPRGQNPKLTPAMAAIVAQGGYGNYPIAALDPAYAPGNVYYLARINGAIDALLLYRPAVAA